VFYQTDRDTCRNSGTLFKLKELNTIDREEGKNKKLQEGYIDMCVPASGREDNGVKQGHCSQKFMGSVFHYQRVTMSRQSIQYSNFFFSFP
jgi:hypothetical protein